MKIENANLKDAEELAKIDTVANSELSGWSPNDKFDFVNIIKESRQDIVVAREDKDIIGYASSRQDKESKWLWLEDLYVLKEWRRKGVAKLLINFLLKYNTNKMRNRKLVLLTADRNLDIFSKLGFKKTMNFMEYSEK